MSDKCYGRVGERPWWMSEGQYDPCHCELPPGHEGEHQCEHTRPSSAVDPEVTG